jgi:hypothetical protein
MIKIFAFDPGQTTGVALAHVTEDGKSFTLVKCEDILWEDRFTSIHGLFKSEGAGHVHIVVENFRLFPHKAKEQIGSEFPSAKVIGTIEALCYVNMMEPGNIVFQVPSDIAKVKVLEDDIPSVAGSPHKVDAYRHARLYFLKHFYMNPFTIGNRS